MLVLSFVRLISRNKRAGGLTGLPPHLGVIPGIVIDPCVVHEEVGKRNLLAGALVVIYVFDYR